MKKENNDPAGAWGEGWAAYAWRQNKRGTKIEAKNKMS